VGLQSRHTYLRQRRAGSHSAISRAPKTRVCEMRNKNFFIGTKAFSMCLMHGYFTN
jgi:hypothetical protein